MLFQTCHVVMLLFFPGFFFLKNLYTAVFHPFIVTVGVMLQKRTKPFHKNSLYALCHVIALCEITPNTNLGMLHQVGSQWCRNAVGSNMSCNAPVQICRMEIKSKQSNGSEVIAYESYGLLFKWTMNWHCIKKSCVKILQNYSFCVPQNKITHTGLERHERE